MSTPESNPPAARAPAPKGGGKSRQRGAERAPLELADDRRRRKNQLAPEYEFTPHYVRIGGGPWMHFLDEGNPAADTLLCVHGNPTWSFHYRHLVRHFRATHRVVAPDLIGCGFSEKPLDWPYRLAAHIDALAELVDELGLERLTLVVQDWGAAIGLGLAGRRPERVERLVILNSAAFRGRALPPRIALARTPLLGSFAVRQLGLFSRLALRWAVERKQWSTAERRGYLVPYRSAAERVALEAFVRDIPLAAGHPSYAELERVEQGLARLAHKPALLVWGERDWCFTPEFLERYRQLLPGAEVVRRPEAGHWVLEDSGPEVLAAIEGFLGAHPLPAARPAPVAGPVG
jgi:pimeloyl-ACP methyl ester carboxylesterase